MSVIEELTTELAKLPGIGRKTATRLTYHLLKQPAVAVTRLARTIDAVVERVRPCTVCGNLSETEPCVICADGRRDSTLICVVEEASDIGAIERSGEYRGRYHVLGGRLSPLDGVGPEDLRIGALEARLADGTGVREVILATNPSMEGEVTATYVRGLLETCGVRVTRIALGLPMGGELEYADGVTIARALAARREMGDG
ncbi:MAG: recombination mediator RecR [Gemmatimonadota bacterium]|nr:recombination mediator RecR [Gemmatimonadota bacterium]MDH4350392.1 recombination mediator RecR [Gemmatimonadota bacterium]MDH5195884.1 recombination mediator RecR [Gemmatimonadota bacterium]